MREHTITMLRSLLASQESDMIADLKDKEHHKFRNLSEVRFARASMGKLFSTRQVKDAATRAGIKDRGEIKALQLLLVNHPEAILNTVFWKTIGRGAASAFLHGKFDTSYSPGAVGGPLSREASSFERIGGKIGTGLYKAGRVLQKSEKWFNVGDPDDRRTYTRGSAFSQHRRGAVDACVKQRVSVRGGPDAWAGHEMGSPEYERCMNDAGERSQLQAIKSNSKHYQHLPSVLKELGVDPAAYMKSKRNEFTFKRGKHRAKRHKHLKGRARP